MQQVMVWVGTAYTVLSGVAMAMTGLSRLFPGVPVLTSLASGLGTLALDLHKILGGD